MSATVVRLSWPIVCTLAAIILTGCEEDIAAREDLGMPFSLYGVLSPELDTQSIRIFPIEIVPSLGLPEPLDALVTSVDLTTGERVTWRDSVVADRRGMFGHIFWAPFRAEVGHAYHIEAVRLADGAVSQVDVTIPESITARISEENAGRVTVVVQGTGFRPLRPEIEYTVRGAVGADTMFYPILKLRRSYEGMEVQRGDDWIVTVDVLDDARVISAVYEDSSNIQLPLVCPRLSLHRMTLEVVVGNAAWNPPGGVFDAALLADPAVVTNVVNGFGFVGGGYRASLPLYPTRAPVELACLKYEL